MQSKRGDANCGAMRIAKTRNNEKAKKEVRIALLFA
jgi:hypothetical protein